MMVSPVRQTKVQGEINICRYLLRVLGAYSHLSDPELSARISYWLDIADSLLRGDAAEKSSAVKNLVNYLATSRYLGGDFASYVDMVVLSAFKQTATCAKFANEPSIKKWMSSLGQ